jgi:Zn-dependent peptidase ImmA (M78 family)/transcriptional regulator with XRE-family HTH domain
MFNTMMFTTVKDAAGLTQIEIAQHAGVSQATVSKIENGFEEPSRTFLESVAEIAGVPVEIFDSNDDLLLPPTLFDIFHKKRLTLPQKPLKKANASAQLTRMEVGRLLRSFEVPVQLPFPSLSLDEHESAEEVASLVRAMWRVPVGPMPNLVAAVEATGTPVLIADLGHEKLGAMSLPGAGYGGHIILLNGSLPASAQRFALAHEVGHLVMHEGVASPLMEKEADAFASGILMPASEIRSRLRNVRFRDLGALKAYWRVSLAALIFRANALGVITERHYRTLNMELNGLPNGRKREPGEFPREEPQLIRNVIEAYLRDGYSLENVSSMMVIREGNLRVKYLSEPPPRRGFRLVHGEG